MKRTKILCTIGPASKSPEILHRMVESGMNAVRVNTSHGSFDDYREIIQSVRKLADIPIIMDTQGPKIRLRMTASLRAAAGNTIRIGFDPRNEFFLDADIYEYLQPGDRMLLDDGAFEAVIEEVKDRFIRIRFNNGGHLISGRAVNFPKKTLPLAPLTEKDMQSLVFAREMNVDFIDLSFTRGKADILACRRRLGDDSIKIIAKIENQQGIDNFEEILEYADGVMIARGDMGVELAPEEVPIIQKRLIHECNAHNKLVITATQMLQSMIFNPSPTRAEISDVANAILDGSDMVMLSGETATGKYPVKTVQMMSRIAQYAEKFIHIHNHPVKAGDVERAICDSIKTLCATANVTKIVSVTRRGNTAKLISRLRLQPEILALTSQEKTFRELHMYYGIHPVMYPNLPGSIRTATAGMFLFEKGLLGEEDLVLFASGEYNPSNRATNTIQVLRARDLIEYCKTFGIPQ